MSLLKAFARAYTALARCSSCTSVVAVKNRAERSSAISLRQIPAASWVLLTPLEPKSSRFRPDPASRCRGRAAQSDAYPDRGRRPSRCPPESWAPAVEHHATAAAASAPPSGATQEDLCPFPEVNRSSQRMTAWNLIA